jgi:hypothetical protein
VVLDTMSSSQLTLQRNTSPLLCLLPASNLEMEAMCSSEMYVDVLLTTWHFVQKMLLFFLYSIQFNCIHVP